MTYVLTFPEGMQAGRFRIPPGCVLSVQSYTDFLAHNGLLDEIAALAPLTADEAATEGTAQLLASLRARMEAARRRTSDRGQVQLMSPETPQA